MKHLIYILLAITLFSCEDPIDIDHPSGGVRYSVEGEVTTVKKKYRVFVSASAEYDAPEVSFVENATVNVYDNTGNVFPYDYLGNGVYISSDSIQGEIGKSYFVEVALEDGTILKSYPETIEEVAPIDSFYSRHVSEYNYVGGPPRPIDDAKTGYYLFFDATEPVGEGDAYRWKGYLNGEYLSDSDYLFYVDDRGADGNEFTEVNLPFLAQLGDTVTLNQLSISLRYVDYLFALQTEIQPRGIFSTPPAPVIGNLYDTDDVEKIVFGYFYASDVDSKTHVVTGTKQ